MRVVTDQLPAETKLLGTKSVSQRQAAFWMTIHRFRINNISIKAATERMLYLHALILDLFYDPQRKTMCIKSFPHIADTLF